VFEALLIEFEHVGELLEEADGEDEQVVEVHRVGVEFLGDVAVADLLDFIDPIVEVVVAVGDDLSSRVEPVFSMRLNIEASTSGLGKRRCLVSMSQSAMTRFESRDFWSSRSRMENERVKPRSSAWRRRMRLPIEWKVPAQSAEVSWGRVRGRARSFRGRPCW
jgi:hypothetical protein